MKANDHKMKRGHLVKNAWVFVMPKKHRKNKKLHIRCLWQFLSDSLLLANFDLMRYVAFCSLTSQCLLVYSSSSLRKKEEKLAVISSNTKALPDGMCQVSLVVKYNLI